MDVLLWIIASVLAVAFLAAGAFKLSQPKAKLAAAGMGWTEDYSARTIKLIAGLEVLAALGLVLPPALDIAPVLAPLAAIGLVLVMAGAAVVHARRKESQLLVVNVVLLALAAFVAWGRLGPYSF
ncbi:DoxX family protein [Actinokineospora diospyrosa]|uniref:DoxX-like family protein n=1 Tax=Actinokineospora diospyrosa TaxID=103728 RepID=A0ABT1I6N7_9PSEU|nr:DoxX family protein [Actinokineospora diospyrosa]MCP2268263.1 DoxX-like family protein [Actinokineospora diospyrosa]